MTRRVEIIGKKKFAAAALNEKDEIFVVHMAALNVVDSSVHPSWQNQISSLDVKEVTIPFKYADYTNVFSPDCTAELPEHTDINDYLIDLIDDK